MPPYYNTRRFVVLNELLTIYSEITPPLLLEKKCQHSKYIDWYLSSYPQLTLHHQKKCSANWFISGQLIILKSSLFYVCDPEARGLKYAGRSPARVVRFCPRRDPSRGFVLVRLLDCSRFCGLHKKPLHACSGRPAAVPFGLSARRNHEKLIDFKPNKQIFSPIDSCTLGRLEGLRVSVHTTGRAMSNRRPSHRRTRVRARALARTHTRP